MKQYAKILTRKSPEIPDDIKANFPNITELKPKEGLFVGPQIKKLITVNNVIVTMDEIKRKLKWEEPNWMQFLLFENEDRPQKSSQ